LTRKPDDPSVLDEQLQWHRKSQQGCVFASQLAKAISRTEPGGFYENYWARTVLRGGARDVVQAMASFVAESHQDPQRQIVSCLLPELTTQQQLGELIRTIKAEYAGALVDYEDSPSGPFTLVRIRFPLSNDITAYALGFGRFDWMPATRQSPYTELSLPVKTKQQLKEKYGRFSINRSQPDSRSRHEDPTFVHLADVEMDGVTKDTPTDTRYWDNTQALKKARLKGDMNDRAKGKVTFSFPGPAAQFS